MLLKHTYFYFIEALPLRFCNDLISYGKEKKLNLARIGSETVDFSKPLSKKQIKETKKIRNSDIVFLDDPWILKEILPFVKEANENSNWKFQFDDVQSTQFTVYNKNQFYNWHTDSFKKPLNGKIRKLSVSVILSNKEDYQGGDLQFDTSYDHFTNPELKKNIVTCQEANTKGSIIVFPSFVAHRVTPVTKGTRYSLVLWYTGNPFI